MSFKKKYSTCSQHFCFFVFIFFAVFTNLCLFMPSHFRTLIVCCPKGVTPFQIFVRCYRYWIFCLIILFVFQFFPDDINKISNPMLFYQQRTIFFFMRDIHVCPCFCFKLYFCCSCLLQNYASVGYNRIIESS